MVQNDPTIEDGMEKDVNKEVGSIFLKIGGIGALGTLAIFVPIQASIVKKTNKYIQKELIDVHNNTKEQSSADISMKLGINTQRVCQKDIFGFCMNITF